MKKKEIEADNFTSILLKFCFQLYLIRTFCIVLIFRMSCWRIPKCISDALTRLQIPDEIVITFSVSKNKFLYSLINKSKPYHDGKAQKPTMLSKVRCNVDLLIRELNKCDTHYVRCIKPRYLTITRSSHNRVYFFLYNKRCFPAGGLTTSTGTGTSSVGN